MADNSFLDATEYANTMLLLVKNQMTMGRLVNGQFRNDVTDENGLSVNVKRPPRFVAQDGATLAAQPVITGSANLAVDQYKNVHVDVGDLEQVQSYNQLMQTSTMKSAASELANTIDGFLLELTNEFSSEVGTPGTAVSTPTLFNAGHTRLMDGAVPNVDLNAVVSFADGAAIRGTLLGGNIDGVNRTALEKTRIPVISEIDLYASNNLRSVTAGTRLEDTGPAVDGAAENTDYRLSKDSESQDLTVKGCGANATVVRGDTFTIAGVYAVNPRSRENMTYLRQFVVLADVTLSGTGTGTLSISPPIIVTGTNDGVGTITNTAFQTCSAIPADSAAIVFNQAPSATYSIRSAFHKEAIALVSARLMTPFSDTSSFVSDPETGIGIRYWRGSDISTGRHIHRWDTIYGATVVDRSLGVRLNG
tara:strand:- start:17887 stop:19146 length:1260 start_codon:yes stop_codon:yes gene_type:complete